MLSISKKRCAEDIAEDKTQKRSAVAFNDKTNVPLPVTHTMKKAIPLSDLSGAPVRDLQSSKPSVAKQSTVQSNVIRSQSGNSVESTEAKPSAEPWNCAACTYLNSKRAMKCGMCGR